MSSALSKAAVDAVKSTKMRDEALLKRLRHLKLTTEPDVVLERPGRPTFRFVDVGVKFVDVKDRLRRVHEAKRRSTLKRRRRELKVLPSDPAQPDVAAAATA